MHAVLLVISENLGQTYDGALNTQITPCSWSLDCIQPVHVGVQIPAVRDQLPRAVSHWHRYHWRFLLNKCMELWEEWVLKSHPEGRVGKRGVGEERAAFFSSCKRNLRRNELVPQRKGKEIVDFCPEHTRDTVGKIWHTKAWNFYVSLKKKLWVKFWFRRLPSPIPTWWTGRFPLCYKICSYLEKLGF